MNGQYRLRLRPCRGTQNLLHRRRREVERRRIDIRQQNFRPATKNRTHAREETERRRNHCVAGANIRCRQRQPDRIRAARAANRMRHFTGVSRRRLEAGNLRSQNEPLRSTDALNRRQQFVSQRTRIAGKNQASERVAGWLSAHLTCYMPMNQNADSPSSIGHRLTILESPQAHSKHAGGFRVDYCRRCSYR